MNTITNDQIRRYSIRYTIDNADVTLEALTFDDITDTLSEYAHLAYGPIVVVDNVTRQRINLWAGRNIADWWTSYMAYMAN